MQNELDYRDKHEQSDVAPVLVDRLRNSGVRVVVRYPRDVRTRARNRLFITFAVVAAWLLIGLQIVHRPWLPVLRALIGGLFWPLGPALVLIMAMLWWRAQRMYVLEADADGLTLEVHGPLFKRQWRYRREWIKEIRIEKSLSGRLVAVTIGATTPKLTRRLFDDLDERHLTIIADALREGLRMPVSAPQQ